jgi:hypothetical protein
MDTDLALIDKDPTELGFPPSLPMELAARTGSIRDICESYHLSKEEWDDLRQRPTFIQACEEALKLINEPGGSFKIKARTMAEALLPRMMKLATHTDFDVVPANVQADLIKAAVRIAGLDQSIDQKGAAAGKAAVQNPLMIQINLR